MSLPAIQPPRPARLLLGLLLLADLTFLILHLINVIGDHYHWFYNPQLSLETDNGAPEAFQYIQTVWTFACLMVIGRRHRIAHFFVWAGLFLYIVLDDAVSIHEPMGNVLATKLHLPQVWRFAPGTTGQLLYLAGVGGCFLILLLWTWWRSPNEERRIGICFFWVLVGLVLAGIVFDAIHDVFVWKRLIGKALAIFEDLGEMIAMSFGCAIAFHFALDGQIRRATPRGIAGALLGRSALLAGRPN